MPIKINVGPPVLTINQGSTVMVTTRTGEIDAGGEQGIFAADTRFLSHYAISANGEPWSLLTSAATSYYAVRIVLVNREFLTEDGTVPEGTIALTIQRTAGDGIHEDIEIRNHNLGPVRFNLEIALRSDFADIFEVRSHCLMRRGRIRTAWHGRRTEIETTYVNGDFKRRFVYRIEQCRSRPEYANGRISFEIALGPGETWRTRALYLLDDGARVPAPLHGCSTQPGDVKLDELQRQWLESATQLSSPNEDIDCLWRQSVEDTGALRLYDHDFAPGVWLPAAGVPWYMTVFGRDSLIVSLQNMAVNAPLALGALRRLGELQATERDDSRDAQPGKIEHEIRFGELAHLRLIPHTPYYGSADVTPLYLVALHETWRWIGDDQLLRRYRDVALRCLEWIDAYGDLDHDGFQEYRTFSPRGYENQGWKDSEDAVVYPDGSQVKQPKALCELQGYVFDAWLRMAQVFDALGDGPEARALRQKAATLQKRFEERFWCEDIGGYAFALDADKQPVKTVASNMGHLLWSGIARPDHAARVVSRLMAADMNSGWGIRTLSADHPAYNPFSYHRGSVWPHDNGIAALGFKRYGFAEEAARIARDVSEAASYFVSYRLPELYAGMPRGPDSFPVLYPGANVPQAWAAGSVFHLVQSLLGLQADAPVQRLYVDPTLPKWLPEVTLRHLAIGAAKVDLRFWRQGEQTNWEVLGRQGPVEVEHRPWLPWAPGPEAPV